MDQEDTAIKFTMHVAWPKRPQSQFKPVQQSRQQVLRAYCPNIYTVPIRLHVLENCNACSHTCHDNKNNGIQARQQLPLKKLQVPRLCFGLNYRLRYVKKPFWVSDLYLQQRFGGISGQLFFVANYLNFVYQNMKLQTYKNCGCQKVKS